MNQDPLDRIAFISAIEVPDGAVIVVQSDRQLTIEAAERLREHVQHVLPNHKVLVLPPGLNLDVMAETTA